jgi:hypothetical protein
MIRPTQTSKPPCSGTQSTFSVGEERRVLATVGAKAGGANTSVLLV